MYFHDTNNNNNINYNNHPPNGHPIPQPAATVDYNNYHHHYNNNINHYCNDGPTPVLLEPCNNHNDANSRTSQQGQRQSGQQAYIQKAMNRQTGASGRGYDTQVDTCNTETNLLSDGEKKNWHEL